MRLARLTPAVNMNDAWPADLRRRQRTKILTIRVSAFRSSALVVLGVPAQRRTVLNRQGIDLTRRRHSLCRGSNVLSEIPTLRKAYLLFGLLKARTAGSFIFNRPPQTNIRVHDIC